MTLSANQSLKQVFVAGVVIALVAFAALFVFWIARVFLLIFIATVIAVFLRGCSTWIGGRLHISPGWGLAVLIVAVIAGFGVIGWFLAPRVTEQFSQLRLSIPEAVQRLIASGGIWSDLLGKFAERVQGLMGAGSKMEDWGIDATVVGFLSIYLASQPSLYRYGIMALTPPRRRDQVRHTMHRLTHVLWRWMIGRIVAMVIIGVLVCLATWMVGVPLPFTFGLIAGLLEFVPYVGAIISAIPAILLALAISPTTAWITLIAYFIVHMIDGYIVIPLVERQAVHLAPGLVIVSHLCLYLTAGLVGLLASAPLAACIVVLLNMYYIQRPVNDSEPEPT